MTTPNYDDILVTLDRTAKLFEHPSVHRQLLPDNQNDARLLREAMEVVRAQRSMKAQDKPYTSYTEKADAEMGD